MHQTMGVEQEEYHANSDDTLLSSNEVTEPTGMGNFTVTTIPGYFSQDEPHVNPSTFEYDKCALGLINRSYETDEKSTTSFEDGNDTVLKPWERFAKHVAHLNDNSPIDVEYKVLYLGRHGEGWHNVAQAKYGDEAWDNHWSLLSGDDSSYWSDAQLTPTGYGQALTAAKCFQQGVFVPPHPQSHQQQTKGATPQRYYVSPLARCLETARLEFDRFYTEKAPLQDSNFRPVVKELLREELGRHTCDRRSSRTWIAQKYPQYVIEGAFTEDDELWDADVRETQDQHRRRAREVLCDIFRELRHDGADKSSEGLRRRKRDTTFISITAHGGTVSRILEVIGHRSFHPRTGAILPTLVRIEWLKDTNAVNGEH